MIVASRTLLLRLALAISIVMSWHAAARSSERATDSDDSPKMRSPKITTLGYVTWWSHDAIGYHPAIYLKLENNSSFDLSGVIVHYQGRFTDLRNGYVTVARTEKRRDFRPHEQISLMLRGPKAWELPIDSSAWPTIECKVMCRVGDVGDEGTQELAITRLEQMTMTDDEALAQLTEQTGVGRVPRIDQRDIDQSRSPRRVEHAITSPAKALMATAGSLLGTRATTNEKQSDKEQHEKKISSINIPSSLPALGDDFYLYEKFYGLPASQGVVPSRTDMTWVSYPGRNLFEQVIVGSRASSGKADLIIVTIPARLSPKESQLAAIAKLLIGKSNRAQNLPPFAHSVRYLPSGRLEISKTQGQDFYVVTFAVPKGQGEDAVVLAVSRLAGDLEGLLSTYSRRVQMLTFLLPGLAPESN